MFTLRSLRAAAAGAALAGFGAAPSLAQLDDSVVENFARLPLVQDAAISPNGEYIATIASDGSIERVVVVAPLAGGDPVVMRVGNENALALNWVSDEQIAVVYRDRHRVFGQTTDLNWIVLVNADGQGGATELNNLSQARRGRNVSIAGRLADDPHSILLSVAQPRSATGMAARRGQGASVYLERALHRYDLRRNSSSLVDTGNEHTVTWVVGADGEAVFRQDINRRAQTIELFAARGRGWDRVYRSNYEEERFGRRSYRNYPDLGMVQGMSPDGQYLFFSSIRDRNRTTVSRFNVQTQEVEYDVGADPVFDVSNIIRDWRNNHVIGVSWIGERRNVVYFEPEFAELQAELDELFPGADAVISSWDNDFNRVVVRADGAGETGAFYLVDFEAGSLSLIAPAYPNITPDMIGDTEWIEYTGRDGMTLYAYLTLPPGRSDARGLPMVVMPHGGPEARDTYGFDMWADFLAFRGYAVLRPQFRGSTGMGREYVEAGYRRWGREMQDDVSDGVLHLVESGRVDADRVCIFGWSYGGYAALAGATLTPELYRCVIAGAPVSDLIAMMEYESRPGREGALEYWRENIGDWSGPNPTVTRAQVEAVSPAYQVANVQAPVLLIHPREDIIVPLEQSEIMAAALERAGKPHELLVIDNDGHNLLRVNTRVETLQAMDRFLRTHNPPD
jgi:dipeptidyl aminopeptidase/acylaminoacyl peptidase